MRNWQLCEPATTGGKARHADVGLATQEQGGADVTTRRRKQPEL